MSRHAANPAASPSLSSKPLDAVTASLDTDEFDSDMPSFSRVFVSSRKAASQLNFRVENAGGAFGPESFDHFVSRLLLGHSFGAYPAPCGAASFCFGFAALRVMVPP